MDPLVATIYRWLERNADGIDTDSLGDLRILAERMADWLETPDGKYLLHLTKKRYGNFPRQ